MFVKRTNHLLYGLLLGLLGVAPLVPSSSALAQGSSSDSSPTIRATPGIEEMVITARRRNENLQETPVSVTAFRVTDLIDRTATRIDDISNAVPNLKFDGASGSSHNSRIYIRGVGQDDPINTSDPGVGIYVDGVYLARAQGSLLSLSDVDRVEALRGPQGTLYGKNTIGGAINVITTKPGPDFEGLGTVRLGNFRTFDSRLMLNVPLLEDLAFARLSIATETSDGYTSNQLFGDNRNDNKLLAGRAAVRLLPTEDLDILLSFDRSIEDEKLPLGECRFSGGGLSALAPLAGIDFAGACSDTRISSTFKGTSDVPSKNELDTYGANGTVIWERDDYTLKSISAWRRVKTDARFDIDATGVRFFQQDQFPGEHDQLSQEFQLSGMAWDDRLQFVSGLYYFRETADSGALTLALPDSLPVLAAIGSPLFDAVSVLNNVTVTNIANLSYAAYGQAAYDVTPWLSLTAGIRRTEERKELDHRSVETFSGRPIVDAKLSERFDAWTPSANVRLQLSDDVNAYAGWSRGFKSGGFNGRAGTDVGQLEPFDPEFVDSFEAGIKSSWFDNHLVVNAAYFYNDYDDIQLTVFSVSSNGGFASNIRNAAEADVQGVELEFRARPFEGLELSGSLGLIDADYDDFVADLDGDGIVENNSGLDFKHTPPYQYNIAAAYSHLVANLGVVTARADWFQQGRVFYNTTNSQSIKQSKFGLLDLRVSLELDNGHTDIAFWGKNFLNREYLSGAIPFDALGFDSAYYAQPRTYGVEITRRF